MFEANSLSVKYHLRDLERQFEGPRLRDYRVPKDQRATTPVSDFPNASGLLAYAAVILGFCGLIWL